MCVNVQGLTCQTLNPSSEMHLRLIIYLLIRLLHVFNRWLCKSWGCAPQRLFKCNYMLQNNAKSDCFPLQNLLRSAFSDICDKIWVYSFYLQNLIQFRCDSYWILGRWHSFPVYTSLRLLLVTAMKICWREQRWAGIS